MTLEEKAYKLEGVYGVYMIRNTVLRKSFIGKADNVGQELGEHLEALRTNRHPNAVMQLDYINARCDGFEVKLLEGLEHGDSKNRYRLYRQWVDDYSATNPRYGYNIIKTEKPKKLKLTFKKDNKRTITPEDRVHNYRVIEEMKAARNKRARKELEK